MRSRRQRRTDVALARRPEALQLMPHLHDRFNGGDQATSAVRRYSTVGGDVGFTSR